MTENQNLQDYARKLGDAAWETAKKAGKIAHNAVFDPDIPKKIYQGLKDGAKTGENTKSNRLNHYIFKCFGVKYIV